MRARRAGLWLALVCLSPGLAAGAANLDRELKAFLGKFADMAAHGAADSMAKVTRFPLRNRVYQAPEKISAGGFKHQFAENRFREFASCLKSTRPQPAARDSADLGEWAVDCDGSVFYFAREGDRWRFTGFENVNE